MPTERDLEQELIDLGHVVERLRVHYQQYFMGFEKRPPTLLRDQVERRFKYSPLIDARRASLKFRYASIVQKYRTFEIYWDRILREIEDGRFNREIFARNVRIEDGLLVRQPRADGEGAVPDGPPADAPAPPHPPASEPPPAPPPPPDPDVALFRSYVVARESLGLPVAGITETAFRASLERQRLAQSERLGGRPVAFEVAIKEGKVILLARAADPS